MVGVNTTSIIAVLGAAGLAIGLALQGSLSNFAAGILIVIYRPYKVGDYIEAGNYAGTVKDIQIFSTVLKTPDNKIVVVPNGSIMNGSIVNYSDQDTRRIDLIVSCGYEDDIDKVRSVLEDILKKEKRVLKDPKPQIAVTELADLGLKEQIIFRSIIHFWRKSRNALIKKGFQFLTPNQTCIFITTKSDINYYCFEELQQFF